MKWQFITAFNVISLIDRQNLKRITIKLKKKTKVKNLNQKHK